MLLRRAGGAMLLAAAPFVHATARPRTIRLGHVLSAQSLQGRTARFFAAEVDRLSGGRLRVQLFGNATLGTDFEMQQALQQERQELMVCATALLGHRAKEMALWDTPFLFADSREAAAVLDGPAGEKAKAGLAGSGLTGLDYWDGGFRHISNRLRPIERLEDLQGLRLRLMPNSILLDSFRALGVRTVPMLFGEVFDALQSGAVDGQEGSISLLMAGRLHEVQKHLTLTRHAYSPWLLVAGESWWKRLAPEERAVLRRAALRSRAHGRRELRTEEARALAELKARGLQVRELPPAQAERMRARLAHLNPDIAASAGMALWRQTQAQLAQLRGQA